MKNRIMKLMTHMILMLLSFICVFPIYWMIVSSLKNSSDIFGYDIIAGNPSLQNYFDAFHTVPLVRMMFNSLVISIGTAAVQLLVAVLFAYAFTRWNFKGKNLIYGFITVTWLIPVQVIMVPNYTQIISLGLNNSLIAMILPHCCSVFANITMYQNFNAMPRALIDAARMDGSSELQILRDIILPNMKASVVSLGIVLVINAWNDYLWPTLVARRNEIKPIQIGLKAFTGTDTNLWGASMAAATISTIPILIIYILMSQKIINSFMKGGIK